MGKNYGDIKQKKNIWIGKWKNKLKFYLFLIKHAEKNSGKNHTFYFLSIVFIYLFLKIFKIENSCWELRKFSYLGVFQLAHIFQLTITLQLLIRILNKIFPKFSLLSQKGPNMNLKCITWFKKIKNICILNIGQMKKRLNF